MMGKLKQIARRLRLDEPAVYRIKVQGRLSATWSAWFDGLTISAESDGDGMAVTTLAGSVADQGALYGLLSRIRDLGLPLLSVECVGKEVEK
jgi:hypothetical protein